jgi:phosphoribosylglycinamide formyltransferase 2
MFVQGDDVIFSEVSPRPHDTGLVTLISQDLSEFALHVRAILGLPIPNIHQHGPSASCAVLVEGDSSSVQFGNLHEVLSQPDTQIRLFGKPDVAGQRRMAVTLARDADLPQARAKAHQAASAMKITL